MSNATDITQPLEDRLVAAWERYNNPKSHQDREAAEKEIKQLHDAIMNRSLKEQLK